jgi:hypothetical protein
MADYSKIQMHKIDGETGREIPLTDDEKRRTLDALREAIRKGQVKYSPEVLRSMGIRGLTQEIIESWLTGIVLPRTVKRPGYLTVLVCGEKSFADQYTVYEWLEYTLDACEDRQLQMILVQGGACPANVIAGQEWGWRNDSVFNVIRSAEVPTPISCSVGIAWHHVDLCLCFCRPGSPDASDLMRLCREANVPILSPYDDGADDAAQILPAA